MVQVFSCDGYFFEHFAIRLAILAFPSKLCQSSESDRHFSDRGRGNGGSCLLNGVLFSDKEID